MKSIVKFLVGLALTFGTAKTYAQSDSLLVKSNDYLLGEIKSMERGVLVIETAYSKSDFKVKWSEI
jgi:hypothetical protein